MLNKIDEFRDELLETCRHRRKHLLVSLLKKKEPPDTTKVTGGTQAFKKTKQLRTFQFSQNLIQIKLQIQIVLPFSK
jgi:hypothetical protein